MLDIQSMTGRVMKGQHGYVSKYEFNRDTDTPLYTPLCVLSTQTLAVIDTAHKIWVDLTQGEFERFMDGEKIWVFTAYYQNTDYLPEGYVRYV